MKYKIPENWSIMKFEDLVEINPESMPESTDPKTELFYIDLSSVKTGKIDYPSEPMIFKEAPSRARRIVKDKDILMATVRPNLKGFGLFENNSDNLFIASTGFAVLRASKCNGDYIYQSLYSHFIEKQIENMVVGSNYPALNNSDVASLRIAIPSDIREQQKIAEILSKWDQAIEKLEKLIELKGKSFQYLSEGLTQMILEEPSTKFHSLSSLGNTLSGLNGKNKDDFGSGKPYITYLNVFKNHQINIEDVGFVRINLGEKQNKVAYGDIIFTTSSETPNEVGMTSVVIDEIIDCHLNSFCFIFRLNSFDVLDPNFASYFFRSCYMRNLIMKLAQGSTRFNLSKEGLMKLEIPIPPKDTQKKLIEVYSAAIKEQLLLKQMLSNLKIQKQGLMQKLLTGKVRVKV
jgi:type I restriction enzyme S subunit